MSNIVISAVEKSEKLLKNQLKQSLWAPQIVQNVFFFFHPKVLGLVSIKILIKSFRMIAKYFKCSLSALAVCKDFHFTDYFVQ